MCVTEGKKKKKKNDCVSKVDDIVKQAEPREGNRSYVMGSIYGGSRLRLTYELNGRRLKKRKLISQTPSNIIEAFS